MMENYLVKDFRRTAAQRFPAQAEQLNATFDARLRTLWEENAGASREKKEHLRRQILPGIAAYETLQTVMPKDEALRTVHGYVEQLAVRAHRSLAAALRVPGLYRLVPGIFVRSTRTAFGPAAGFAATELRTDSTTWRIDMTRCPYHDTCGGMAVRSSARASATATISAMQACTRSSSGTAPGRWAAATTAATSA